MIGVSSNGLAVFLELKRKGAKNVCRVHQRAFLETKIRHHAFGLVTDSPEHLEETYHKGLSLRSESLQTASGFLLSQLPRRVTVMGKIVTLTTP